jgi:hypothetical protein
MAFLEKPGVKEVIMKLGRTITAGRKNPPPPDLLGMVNMDPDSPWTLKKERTAYFYSHLVLNSLYYISHENILDLDHETEVLMTVFERSQEKGVGSRIHLLLIKYPGYGKAIAALGDFIRVYMPESKRRPAPGLEQEIQDFLQVEDGWTGYRLLNRYLVLALGCPDRESARGMLHRVNVKLF